MNTLRHLSCVIEINLKQKKLTQSYFFLQNNILKIRVNTLVGIFTKKK